ncbi:MAG: ABC transporter ATP-binding protein [Rhodanobacteraceae bacterium]
MRVCLRNRGMAFEASRCNNASKRVVGMNGLLQTQNLQVAYGDERVLKGVSVQVTSGEFVALIGPNGAGKTTLLHAIAGMATPCGGSVTIAGYDLAKSPREAKGAMGLSVDPAYLPVLLTGRECLALFAGARGLPAIPPAILALAETLSLTSTLDRRIASYSLGMRQKLGILLGLIGEPPLLLLDEPFNGLDPRSALAFKAHLDALVTKGDASVVLATHSLDVAERHATRVVLLMDGRLRKTWDAADLTAMREDSERSLEQAMSEACEI